MPERQGGLAYEHTAWARWETRVRGLGTLPLRKIP